jgi:hypothetical protein
MKSAVRPGFTSYRNIANTAIASSMGFSEHFIVPLSPPNRETVSCENCLKWRGTPACVLTKTTSKQATPVRGSVFAESNTPALASVVIGAYYALR